MMVGDLLEASAVAGDHSDYDGSFRLIGSATCARVFQRLSYVCTLASPQGHDKNHKARAKRCMEPGAAFSLPVIKLGIGPIYTTSKHTVRRGTARHNLTNPLIYLIVCCVEM